MLSAYLAVLMTANWMSSVLQEEKLPLRVSDFVTGQLSEVDTMEASLVSNPDQWSALWQRHRPSTVISPSGLTTPATNRQSDMPTIDFGQYRVIAIFGGLSRNVTALEVDSIKVENHRDVIRVKPRFGQPQPNIAMVTQPFLFLQVSHVRRGIDIEVQTGQSDSGDPTWKKIASFKKPE